MQRPHLLALVALGGAIGAGIRWAVIEVAPSTPFPWPVLLVNLVGCALLGALVGHGVSYRARLLFGTGLCGGLTTFSTFTVEVARLLSDNRAGIAASYLVASVVGGLVCFDRARGLTTRTGPDDPDRVAT